MTLAENTVHQIDALDLLRALPDASVDAVITSPPYNHLQSEGKATGMFAEKQWADDFLQGYDSYGDDMAEADYQTWIASVVAECLRVSKGLVWINHKTRYRNGVGIHPLSFLRFPLYAEVIWNRGISMALNSRRFAPSHEYVFGFGRPHYWDDAANKLMSVWRIGTAHEVQGHPCPFPVRLVSRLITASCPPAGIVLDCFGGSGTTAVAARNLGRRYITGDTDAGYCAIMRRRLSEPYTPQMFAEEADAVDDAPRQVEMFAQGADNAE